MPRLMRCKYCGILQDEPQGAKICVQCGGELRWEDSSVSGGPSYVQAHMELDQVAAPGGQIIERHLILTVQTPADVPAGEQVHSTSGRDALHFVAVLDVSGSMSGAKIAAARQAVLDAVDRLQEGDTFSLVTFASQVQCPFSARRIDAGLRRVVRSAINEVQAGGQTALCGGLELGIVQAREARRATNLVLLLSDGQANIGETDVEAVGRRVVEAREQGITVSTLGVGQDYNEALMAEIAIDGGGRFYHITDASQITAYLTGELGEMASLAARETVARLDLPAGTAVYSLSAAYPVQGSQVTIGDIPLSTTLEIVLRVLLPPQPAGARLSIQGTLHYRSPAGNNLSTALNQVTVRYEAAPAFEVAAGVVRPVARRVLEQMHAASVLSISKAATRSPGVAQQASVEALEAIHRYAQLLGEDDQAAEAVDKSEHVLRAMAAPPAPGMAMHAKMEMNEAMRRQRGSKKFDSG